MYSIAGKLLADKLHVLSVVTTSGILCLFCVSHMQCFVLWSCPVQVGLHILQAVFLLQSLDITHAFPHQTYVLQVMCQVLQPQCQLSRSSTGTVAGPKSCVYPWCSSCLHAPMCVLTPITQCPSTACWTIPGSASHNKHHTCCLAPTDDQALHGVSGG